VYELRVFRARNGDVRAGFVPVDPAVNLDIIMGEAREHI
jgi:hypothetical protein